jgi:GMP synthase (glutamine-hydrolysing)
MRVLVIENAPSAPAGLFGQWLADQGHDLTTIAPTALPPDHTSHDLTVTLGSPAGAWEDKPWIHAQRAWLAAAIADNHPTIGICFGAQLIAEALGGKAAPNTERHAGWIEITDAADPRFAGPWPRWHGDHIIAPEGAEILARSRGTIQAYQFASAVCLQFHPEADEAALAAWAAKVPDWLAANNTTPAALAAQSAFLVPAREAARHALFTHIIARAMAPSRQEQAA